MDDAALGARDVGAQSSFERITGSAMGSVTAHYVESVARNCCRFRPAAFRAASTPGPGSPPLWPRGNGLSAGGPSTTSERCATGSRSDTSTS